MCLFVVRSVFQTTLTHFGAFYTLYVEGAQSMKNRFSYTPLTISLENDKFSAPAMES